MKDAIVAQLDKLSYAHPGYFQNKPALELADFLVQSTGGKLSRACLIGSGTFLHTLIFVLTLLIAIIGSEAMETAMKLARQYHLELSPNSPRVKFIARRGSWHGCTLATLSLGDFKPRKELFNPLLHDNVSHVSPCHPYRDLGAGESYDDYVARLVQELEDEFQRLDPKTVCAFVVEPMVGTVSPNSKPPISSILSGRTRL